MAIFTYSVRYRFVCENCGKQTDWQIVFPPDINHITR